MGFWRSLGRIGGNDEYGDWNMWGALGESDAEKEAKSAEASAAAAAAKTEAYYSSRGMINPSGNDPNALAAQLLRAQFDEWAKSFKPIELNAMKGISFNNPTVLTQAVEKATSSAQGQADTMRGVLSRSNAAMGIAPTQQQEKVSSRILNLDRATAVAGAANKARENVRIQDEQLLLGGVPNQNIVKGTIQA
jgi:hypothetical protein